MHDDRVVFSINAGRSSHLQARRRQALRLGTTLSGAAAALLLGSMPAVAASPACGVLTLTAVTCPASASYPDGIHYVIGNEDTPQDLTVHLADGIAVDTGDDYVNGVTVTNFSGGAASLVADGASTIATHGAGSIGVAGNTGSGDLTINVGNVSTEGFEAHGIVAGSVSGAIDVRAGTVKTTGDYADGIHATGYSGAIHVAAGTVETSGLYSRGIFASSASGDVTVDAGAVITHGDYSVGIEARVGQPSDNGPGAPTDLTVRADSVRTDGYASDGIVAINLTKGETRVSAGNIVTSGENSWGAYVGGFGNVSLSAGTVETSGAYSAGLAATSLEGNVDISADSVATRGLYANAINALAYGTDAKVTVDVGSAVTHGDQSTGIFVGTAGSDLGEAHLVSVDADSVVTNGRKSTGVRIEAGGAIAVDLGSVVTNGDSSRGVVIYGGDGDIDLTVGSIETNGAFAGRDAAGLVLGTHNGNIDASIGSIVTSGDYSPAILTTGYKSSQNFTITGSLTTKGDYSAGFQSFTDSSTLVLDVAKVSTEGKGSRGISATAYAGDTSIKAGLVTTAGAGSTGIEVVGVSTDGLVHQIAVDVGTISTTGNQAAGIDVLAIGSNVTVHAGTLTTAGDEATGIKVVAVRDESQGIPPFASSASGDHAISIDAGTVTTQGHHAEGIVGVALGNAISTVIKVDAVKTTGDYAHGVYAYSAGTGNSISVDAGSVETAGKGAVGIYVVNTAIGGDVKIDVDSVKTTGNVSAGIFAYTYDGNVAIDAGTVDGAGIGVSAIRGDVTIKAGSIHSDHYEAMGISASGKNVSVDVGNIELTGALGTGITALASENVTVTAGSILTTGEAGFGIIAEGKNTTVSVGTVQTYGLGAAGIYTAAFGSNGKFDVTVNELVQTFGDFANGITAISGGTGAIHNNGRVSTNGYSSNGIVAMGVHGVTIDGSNGSVSTNFANSWGIMAYALGGDISITQSDVFTRGAGSVGVYARISGIGSDYAPTTGSISIDIDGIRTFGQQADALVAINSAQDGDIDINVGTVSTYGNGSAGIVALSSYGTVNVTAVDVTTTGETISGRWVGDTYLRARIPTGIYAAGQSVTVTSTGTVSTQGHEASGIFAAASGGRATVHANNVSAHGRFAGAVTGYSGAGGVDITTTGDISMSGARNSYGVLAFGNGPLTVTNTGNIEADASYGARGIFVRTGYAKGRPVHVTNTGSIRASGDVSNGIRAISKSMEDVIVVSTGSVFAEGDMSVGIAAAIGGRTRGGGDDDREMAPAASLEDDAKPVLSIAAADVSVSGKFASAIGANNKNGIVDILADKVVAHGYYANGIASEADTLQIKASSIVADGHGVFAQAGHARIDVRDVTAKHIGVAVSSIYDNVVTVHGHVMSTEADAVEMFTSEGKSVLHVLKGATVTGGGIAGIHGGLTGPGYSVHMFGADGAVINNAGTIDNKGDSYTIFVIDTLDEDGKPVTNGFGATITSSGTIEGDLRLTSFKDTLVNSGNFVAMGDSDFGLGEDLFTNSGTLVVRNLAGEARAAGATSVTFKALERFENSGMIDLRGGAVGDRLTLGGNYVGAGNALLALDVNNGLADNLVIQGAATGSTGIVLNQVGKDATLLSKPIELVKVGAGSSSTAFHMAQTEVGLVHYTLAYNAGSFGLTSRAGAGVYRLAKLGEGAQAIWDQSAQAWSSHMMELRDVESGGSRIWGQAYGGVMNRDQSQVIGDTTYSLDYRQDFYGFQVGADLGGSVNDAGSTVFGVTAGYISSRQNFEQAGDRAKFDSVNLGAYASVRRGAFFANLLGQYDHHSIDANGKTLEWSDKTSGNSYGLQGEIGAHLGSDRIFVEPLASLAWQKTDIDRVELLGQSVDFGKLDGLTGRLGARIGGKARFLGTEAVFYAKGSWVHQFDGKASATLFSGGMSETVDGHAMGDYGQAALGVNILSAGPVSGFIEGNANFGSSAKGGGGRAGIRFKF